MILCPLPLRQYRITQNFGERPEYYAQYGHKGHNGIDFAPLKTMFGVIKSDLTIYAPHDGYAMTKSGTGYGRYITIQSLPRRADGTGHKSDLCHLAQFLIQDGQFVAMGDPIGIMGNTGDSTATHLHWTYKKTVNGIVQDVNNGFGGAINIAPFTLPWTKQPI